MKRRSHIDIADTPEVIWPVVADAEWLAGWNEKVVTVKALGLSLPALAANYDFTFQMSKSGATTVCEATLSQFQPHELVEWTYWHLQAEGLASCGPISAGSSRKSDSSVSRFGHQPSTSTCLDSSAGLACLQVWQASWANESAKN